MSLFRNQKPQQPQQPTIRQREGHLPGFMHRINPLCKDHRHQLNVVMNHIGDSYSKNGQPMAVYACPMCGTQEGWVIDFKTGAPLRLWHHTYN